MVFADEQLSISSSRRQQLFQASVLSYHRRVGVQPHQMGPLAPLIQEPIQQQHLYFDVPSALWPCSDRAVPWRAAHLVPAPVGPWCDGCVGISWCKLLRQEAIACTEKARHSETLLACQASHHPCS